MIKVSYTDTFVNAYYEDIAHRKFQDKENKTLEEVYAKEFQSLIGVDLKTLLCGKYETLPRVQLDTTKKEEIKKIFKYQDKFQKHISELFKKHLDIHTCYYCNIDFINIFKTRNKKLLTGYTLDHITNKAESPYLALSLYNLIPVCYVCNSKLKKEHNIGESVPTCSSFDFDAKVKFKTFMQNENLQIDNQDDFELLLKEDFTDTYEKYIEVFELDGRYEYHKYKVIEMINKGKEYPDSRIKELADLTQKTEEEVKQDLFGEYLFETDDLHKRPLSKLIRDISKELGLV
jgi:5-methylcytosine-specific restriction endonuclease McrA